MAKALQRRRGTTAEHANFTGLEGEFTYNTTEKRIVAHDGATKGGTPMAKKDEVLLKSGGMMTGEIVTNGFFARQGSDSGALVIRGGTDSTSASLTLYGKEHPTNKGWIVFQSNDGSNSKYLVAKPDGSLLWGGAYVAITDDIIEAVSQATSSSISQPTLEGLQSQIAANTSNILPNTTPHVVEYWKRSDGQNWYRKWSNGWIEQGGWRSVSANTTSTSTFTFHIPFSTTDYTLILSKSDANYGTNGHSWTGLNSWTETGFNAYLNYVKKFHYYACGF